MQNAVRFKYLTRPLSAEQIARSSYKLYGRTSGRYNKCR
jgi:hypothetical protein